jgi:hypothetical protein
VWHELSFWHCAGPWGSLHEHVQPIDHSPEHAETKRRCAGATVGGGTAGWQQLWCRWVCWRRTHIMMHTRARARVDRASCAAGCTTW